jgi:biopolymer transport protein ExbD
VTVAPQKHQNGDDRQKKSFPVMKRANKSLAKDIEAFELDVTPFMNLMMFFIPFLATMAAFTHLAIVEFSLPPAQAQNASAGPSKELDISIVITDQGFRIVGTGKKLDVVPKVRGSFQFDQLRALLKAIKFEYPSQKSVVLVMDPQVLYDDIIKFMDTCRESQFPDIGLSGEVR